MCVCVCVCVCAWICANMPYLTPLPRLHQRSGYVERGCRPLHFVRAMTRTLATMHRYIDTRACIYTCVHVHNNNTYLYISCISSTAPHSRPSFPHQHSPPPYSPTTTHPPAYSPTNTHPPPYPHHSPTTTHLPPPPHSHLRPHPQHLQPRPHSHLLPLTCAQALRFPAVL